MVKNLYHFLKVKQSKSFVHLIMPLDIRLLFLLRPQMQSCPYTGHFCLCFNPLLHHFHEFSIFQLLLPARKTVTSSNLDLSLPSCTPSSVGSLITKSASCPKLLMHLQYSVRSSKNLHFHFSHGKPVLGNLYSLKNVSIFPIINQSSLYQLNEKNIKPIAPRHCQSEWKNSRENNRAEGLDSMVAGTLSIFTTAFFATEKTDDKFALLYFHFK